MTPEIFSIDKKIEGSRVLLQTGSHIKELNRKRVELQNEIKTQEKWQNSKEVMRLFLFPDTVRFCLWNSSIPVTEEKIRSHVLR